MLQTYQSCFRRVSERGMRAGIGRSIGDEVVEKVFGQDHVVENPCSGRRPNPGCEVVLRYCAHTSAHECRCLFLFPVLLAPTLLRSDVRCSVLAACIRTLSLHSTGG